MRSILAMLFVTACWSGASELNSADDDPGPDPGQGGSSAFCIDATDCQPAAATCCECPTFATRIDDPKAAVCDDVECPPSSCAQTVEASCNIATNQCELRCKPSVCDLACDAGFVIEANGCLSCACAAAPAQTIDSCSEDVQCVRTRGDCCGCELGGIEIAVLASKQSEFDAGLMCGSDAACPGIYTCDASQQPRCVQGGCQLLPDPPSNACGATGFACAPTEVCSVNTNNQANLYGLGVCVPR